MNVGEWITTLELEPSSPVPIINHYNQLLEKTKATNQRIKEEQGETLTDDLLRPVAGAALRGLLCEAPAQPGGEDEMGMEINNSTSNISEDSMSKKNGNSKVINQVHSSVGSAVLAALEPVIQSLDQFASSSIDSANQDHGHTLPSRKDFSLRILISGMCRVLYQQLHGYKTANGGGFAGIKDSFDKAQNQLGAMIQRNNNDPDAIEEDLFTDNNYIRTLSYVEGLTAKVDCFERMLEQLKDVHLAVTGEAWTNEVKASTKLTREQIQAIAEKSKAARAAAVSATVQ